MKKTILIPTSLYDVSIGQYQAIQAIPEGDEFRQVVDTISILCDLTEEEVMGMTKQNIEHIGGVIGGILDKYDDEYPLERFVELNQRYAFHPNLSRITVAEFADLETLCQEYSKNLPQIMGILYRPIVEEHKEFYRITEYDGEDRSEYFKEMKMAHALGATAFFLRTGRALTFALDSFSKAIQAPNYPRNTDGSPRLSISQGRILLNYRRLKGRTSKRPWRGWLTSKTKPPSKNKK